MPWSTIELNDGHKIPDIAYGTWTVGNGDQAVDQIGQSLDVGFGHIDTAQSYGNQDEVGVALREAGIKRSDVYITTKFSGRDGLSIPASMKQSLDKIGTAYVDLYLIHSPRLVQDNIAGGWATMVELKEKGFAKSVGVSNFEIEHLELLKGFKVKPSVNQILLHPYVYARQKALVEYCQSHDIVVEAYSPLIPVTRLPGGPLDKPLGQIAKRTGATFDQILLAWAKAKGAVVVTNSSKRSRLEGYLAAGDIELTSEEVSAMDAAGKKKWFLMSKALAAAATLVLVTMVHFAR